MCDVRPIRTEVDHQGALADIASLMDTRHATPAGDRFAVLATLVATFEATHVTIALPDPIAAIQFRMEQKRLTRNDLDRRSAARAGSPRC